MGPGTQVVVLLVVKVYNCILEVVQIRHQMKLGRPVLESRTIKKCAIITRNVSVSSMKNGIM